MLKQCRVVSERIDVDVERQVVTIVGKGQQSACTHETVRSALVRISAVGVGKQSAALSIDNNQQKIPSLGGDAIPGNDGRCEGSYGSVEHGDPDGAISGARKGVGEGFVKVENGAPPRLRVPRAKQRTSNGFGNQLPAQLMVAGPLVRTRNLPQVIQTAREVEPHFVSYRLPETKTRSDSAIEGRGLVVVAQSDAK